MTKNDQRLPDSVYLHVLLCGERPQFTAATVKVDAEDELSRVDEVDEAKEQIQAADSMREATVEPDACADPIGSPDEWWWKGIPKLDWFPRKFMYWLFKRKEKPEELLRSWRPLASTPSAEQLLALMRHNDTIYIAASAAILIFTSALGGQVVRTVLANTSSPIGPNLPLYIISHFFLFVPAEIMLVLLCAQGCRNYFQRESRLAALHQHYRVAEPIVAPRINRYFAAMAVFGLLALCWVMLAVFKILGDVVERDLTRAETSQAAAVEPP